MANSLSDAWRKYQADSNIREDHDRTAFHAGWLARVSYEHEHQHQPHPADVMMELLARIERLERHATGRLNNKTAVEDNVALVTLVKTHSPDAHRMDY